MSDSPTLSHSRFSHSLTVTHSLTHSLPGWLAACQQQASAGAAALYPHLGLPLIFWDTYSALYAASMPENVVCPGKGNVVSMCGGGGGASPLNFLPFALTHSQSLTVTHSQSLTHSRQCNGVTPTTNNQQPTNSESLPSHSHTLSHTHSLTHLTRMMYPLLVLRGFIWICSRRFSVMYRI